MNRKPFYFGMSVDDVALEGWCKAENLAAIIALFDSEKLPATFFVVPIDEATDRPFDTLPGDYVNIIRAAHASGHCFAQHGLRHNRFELGVPPAMILDLPHEQENKRYAAANAAALALDHSVENCRARLRQGRTVLENALGFPIRGFRAPALQESVGMFEALVLERYAFDSSSCMQETGWDYILDRMATPPREITRARWLALRAKCPGLMLPLTCDYTWYLTAAKYEKVMAMAQGDFRACLTADVPFVTVCHVDPVQEGEGVRFLREFFAWSRNEAARQGRELEFATLETINGKLGCQ